MPFIPLLCLLAAFPPASNPILISGMMRTVMREGNLQATLDLDTLSSRTHMYGLGPLDSLRGELLIEDGVCLKATPDRDTGMIVKRDWRAKAPFFVYARVPRWIPQPLPDSVRTFAQVESFLAGLPAGHAGPFAFRLEGTMDSARIHVVNLAPGAKVSGPEDVHRGQRDFRILGKPCRVVGFFSTSHQGIFTHHDSFVHAHLVTADGARMGHLSEASFRKGAVKLFLPAD